MNHKAILKLNPTVDHIRDDIAYDADGNEVAYDKQAVEDYVSSQAYVSKRQSEYPNFLDYLDGIVKNDQNQIQAYINACLAVKAKYPKK
jgi:hypothetical protein